MSNDGRELLLRRVRYENGELTHTQWARTVLGLADEVHIVYPAWVALRNIYGQWVILPLEPDLSGTVITTSAPGDLGRQYPARIECTTMDPEPRKKKLNGLKHLIQVMIVSLDTPETLRLELEISTPALRALLHEERPD